MWTDSRVVLDWIRSTTKQNVFVSKKSTKTNEWNQVPTNVIPADHGTRGLEPSEISPKWLKAPHFLQDTESSWKDMKKFSSMGAVTRNEKNQSKVF